MIAGSAARDAGVARESRETEAKSWTQQRKAQQECYSLGNAEAEDGRH